MLIAKYFSCKYIKQFWKQYLSLSVYKIYKIKSEPFTPLKPKIFNEKYFKIVFQLSIEWYIWYWVILKNNWPYIRPKSSLETRFGTTYQICWKIFIKNIHFIWTIFPLVANLSLNMFKKCLIVSSRSKKMENIWCSSKEIL